MLNQINANAAIVNSHLKDNLYQTGGGTAVAGNVLAGTTFSNDIDTGLPGTFDLSQLVTGNIKKGITINGVIGKSTVVDVSDTTMDNSANQLLAGYTAYNALGNKITGVMSNHSGADSVNIGVYGTLVANRLYLRPAYGFWDGIYSTYVDDANWAA